MTRATRTFMPKTRTTIPATSQNREGWPSWDRPLPEQFLQTLLTNTVGRTFYASAQDLLAEAHQVHDAMVATGDWPFIGSALAYARQRGFMRLQPILGLVKLAQAAKDGKLAAGVFFEQAFPEVVQTPNDLLDFMAVLKGLRGNEGGRLVKRVAGAWLVRKFGPESKIASYWAVKYGAQRTEGYSLRDALRLYHPKTGPASPVLAYLNGPRKVKAPDGQVIEDAKAWEEAVWAVPQIKAFERLKLVTEDAEKVTLITEGRLPHEVATPFAGTSKDVWVAIAGQMPVFATLRHLATLERHGVLDATRNEVEHRLTDPETIARSRILPFRFLEAANHVRASWAQDALRQALELSFANVPEIAGPTAIMLDVSTSMTGDYLQKAAIFAICAAKKAQGRVRFMLFSDACATRSWGRRRRSTWSAGRTQRRAWRSCSRRRRRSTTCSWSATNRRTEGADSATCSMSTGRG